MLPKVVQVIPQSDYKVLVYFEDGKIVCFDASKLLDKKVFEPLRDEKVFMGSCTIMNDTLAWDIAGNRDKTKCVDIDPDTLYALEFAKKRI